MQTKPQFLLLTDLAKEIHDETNGMKRKKTLELLDTWHRKYRVTSFSAAEAKQWDALNEVFELAKTITKKAYIPPWEFWQAENLNL